MGVHLREATGWALSSPEDPLKRESLPDLLSTWLQRKEDPQGGQPLLVPPLFGRHADWLRGKVSSVHRGVVHVLGMCRTTAEPRTTPNESTMVMPRNLFLVRHGQSEKNIMQKASNASKAGDAGPDVDVCIEAGTSVKRVGPHEGLVLDRDLVSLPAGIS